jgi:hypothetical protein
LWKGAELWIDPEIDQGFGLADTHGVAGFPSSESFKLGFNYPYARVQRYFDANSEPPGADSWQILRHRHIRHQPIRKLWLRRMNWAVPVTCRKPRRAI